MEYDIKNVAIYLRKSRDNDANNLGEGEEEEEDVLEKHRKELVQFAEDKGWSYVEYPEIGTREKIDVRPKMTELLQDVELEMYDGVLAMHFDRLSGGDEVDQARIKRTFQRSETLFITPDRIYDWNKEQDILISDVEGLASRLEYRAISRRFRQGKARNAKAGFWSNGKPPFPYFYNRETRKADFDEKSAEYLTYRYMVDMALSGYPCTDIAWELNRQEIRSPRGGMWQPAVVRRLLIDEVHLGHMIVGKKRKSASGDIVRKPKTEWITYKNCHKPVKTEREHAQILFLLQQQRETPKRSRAGAHTFSGIIRCAVCGSTMQIQKRPNRPSDFLKSCSHKDPYGNRCGNIGVNISTIKEAVRQRIEKHRDELTEAIREGRNKKDQRLLLDLKEKKLAEIKDVEKQIDRIKDGFDAGFYDADEAVERRKIHQATLDRLEEEYTQLERKLDNQAQAKNEDMLDEINRVLSVIESDKDHKELNRAYKSIIYSIEWERRDLEDPGGLKVNFL